MLDYLYAFIFVAAFALPLVYFAVVWRKWTKVGIASLAVYLITYVALTLSGSYTVANHGGSDWRREWVPKFLMVDYASATGRTKSDITLAGAVYWPCIFLDHLLWHRTTSTDV